MTEVEPSATFPATADISVVIPAFDASATIARAVTSALAQADGRVRTIVVIDDNCRTTENILTAMRDPRIAIERNVCNLGAPKSRNRGLAMTTTPYVTFLDGDDFYHGDFLGPLIRKMQSESADIGFGPSVWWSPQRGIEHVRIPAYRNQEDVFVQWLGRQINVNTASVVWKTDFVRQIKGWDESIGRNQDGEIALRAMLLGAHFAQSQEGAGVWTNDRSLQRITTRTDNLESLLAIVDKLLAIPSKVISHQAKTAACSNYCLMIAHLGYSNDQDEIGDLALAQRLALGVADSSGSRSYRFFTFTRFIPRGPRKLMWKSIRKTRDIIQSAKFRITRPFSARRPALLSNFPSSADRLPAGGHQRFGRTT